ncbi:low molecular weight phosphatase family protein [Staphylococcus chromogenes]|uniref:low molecular weight protein arginine phosphatase n=1 Tax=Staphylococcus chromogenes TaxID=46126 RepID=UPI000D1BF433|nr:low molecular weight protein arginine phosphatase [Staphylococcus chromogenes]PTG92493.1 low molecular weight phosphatase family protein [Staphylococcus chromogenes]
MRIIFVCTGNTCRSPMAESIAKRLLPTHQIESRGLMASEGASPSAHTEEVLKIHDYPEPSLAKQFQKEDMKADLILTMTSEHKCWIDHYFGQQSHVYTLKDYLDSASDIPDPFGSSYEMYLQLFQHLETDIFKLKDRID